jgi:hypothetical protein
LATLLYVVLDEFLCVLLEHAIDLVEKIVDLVSYFLAAR